MKNFNPRSHERSDTDKLNSLGFDFISIHAPTRGATRTDRDQQSGSKRFQSTLPREERLCLDFDVCKNLHISIHAPTRGATICRTRI